MFSSGPLHIAKQVLGDQLELAYNRSGMDTGCSLEDLPEAMNDRDEWW